jgi:hypothetical protein
MAVERTVSTVIERDAPLEAPWHKRISWGAVFAGVVIAVAIMVVLNLLGLAIGLATIDPATGETPGGRTLSIGAGIWWIVSALIALYVGGWVASRLAGAFRSETGTMHGLLVWATSTLAMLWMGTTAVGALVGGTFNALGTGFQVAGQAAATGAETVARGAETVARTAPGREGESAFHEIRQELQELLGGARTPEGAAREAAAPRTEPAPQPTQADRELSNLIEAIVRSGDVDDVDTQDAARQLAERTGISEQEAEAKIESWRGSVQRAKAKAGRTVEELKEEAVEAGEKTAKSLSMASFWAFAALLLGAISAGAGGRCATPKVVVEEPR